MTAARAAGAAPPGLVAASFRVGSQVLFVLGLPAGGAAPVEDLTDAERAVLVALLLGRSNLEIARTRRRSARTIANQVASIFRKLGVRSRSELAALLARTSPA